MASGSAASSGPGSPVRLPVGEKKGVSRSADREEDADESRHEPGSDVSGIREALN
jgi:hypothetical protein